MFQQVVHKVGKSSINYIKRFQNSKVLAISVVNNSNEYQMIHTFLDYFKQGGKYYAQIEIHQEEFRREEKIIDQKLLSISDLQIDYLNLDNNIE